VIPAKTAETQLTITAAADAKPGIFCPAISGAAAAEGQNVVRKAVPVESLLQAFYIKHLVPTHGCPIAVTPGGTFTLHADVPGDKVLELTQGAEAKVVVKVVRTAEGRFPVNVAAAPAFQAAVLNRFAPKPPAIGVKPASIPADKDEAAVTLTVPRQMPVGQVYGVILTGMMNTGKQTILRTAPAIAVKVVAPEPTPSHERKPKVH